jgi:hypothetical protein
MALIDSEGFGMSTSFQDFITYNVFGFSAGGAPGQFDPSIQTAGGMFNDPFLRFWNSYAAVQRLAPAALTSFFFGARTRLNGVSLSTSSPWCYLFNDVSFVNQFAIRFYPDGSITVLRGMAQVTNDADYSGGTVIGAAPPLSMPVQGWQHVEVGGVIDAVAGSVVIRVNGVIVLNLTNVNTKGSAAQSTMRRYGLQQGGADGNYFETQHWYLCDATGAAPWNTFLGDVRVQTLRPTSDDAVQFTPNGLPANWQNAASYPPKPFTNYNASANVGDQDTFVMQQIDTNDVVFGVHVKPLVYKNDAGARSGASILKSGGTTAVGGSVVLSETSSQLLRMYQTDPNTSAQWTAAAVNAIKAGARLVA